MCLRILRLVNKTACRCREATQSGLLLEHRYSHLLSVQCAGLFLQGLCLSRHLSDLLGRNHYWTIGNDFSFGLLNSAIISQHNLLLTICLFVTNEELQYSIALFAFHFNQVVLFGNESCVAATTNQRVELDVNLSQINMGFTIEDVKYSLIGIHVVNQIFLHAGWAGVLARVYYKSILWLLVLVIVHIMVEPNQLIMSSLLIADIGQGVCPE